MIRNAHSRRFPAPVAEAEALLDTLGTPDDRLWPGEDWPPIAFDRPLAPGLAAGHGPVRYVVESFDRHSIRFRFTQPRGIRGHHEFRVSETGDGCEVSHVLTGRSRGLSWRLFWRPLHDAVLEQLLDRAELALTGHVRAPVRWSAYVRLVRAAQSMVVSRITRSHSRERRAKLPG
ncbi:SRPBCC family protein [Amycolatopsis saalfeldensis]|uniref:Polyketide cyclase / dehydrase and lipid transport n=1 Tax=Amycolatopsis saalfeldensis TaxID=394193 RepID=A0A1H8YHK6_9PSEU|nr:SRPBCC family protein [Amycolatopsis saalfeldensis]SEP51607.1 hypothetical protein SAMN04489732_116150 [Amycolatopsis saalfeldensis]